MVAAVTNDAGRELVTSVLNSLTSNTAILDDDGTVLATNDSWREFVDANGLESVPDSVGMNYLDVADAADDPDAVRAAAGIRAVLRGDREQFEVEYPCHSSAKNRWILLRASGFTHDGARYATVAHVDITERRQRERALREAYEISVSDRTFPEQLDELLALGREVLGISYGTLSHVQGEEYVFEAVAAPDDADLTAGETTSLDALPSCKQVIETEETVVFSDAREEAPELLDPEWGITAYLGVPVVVNGTVRGTFCFYSTDARSEQFSDWEVTFVKLLSSWVSDVLERRHYTDLLGALDTAFPDLAFLIDTEGTYRDYLAGSEMVDQLVAPPTELLGQTLHDVLPADTADQLLTTIREAHETGQLQTAEYELTVPAGTHWFEARVAPAAYSTYGPETALIVARDITERKEREQELQETSEMLRSVQQTMAASDPLSEKLEGLLAFGREYLNLEHGFFAQIDGDTLDIRVAVGPHDQLQAGTVIPLSETYCRHTIDTDTAEPLTVEDASEEGWESDPAFERFDLECYVGATVVVDGEVEGTICFADRTPAEKGFTDPQQTFVELLTEWTVSELEQRERERQYRRLTERISDAYYAFDADWTVTYWNDTAAARPSKPGSDIVGKHFWEQCPELTGTVYEDTLREAMETQEPQSCEFYYEEGDYWIEAQAYPDEAGISVISQEITERKEAREAVRESQERLDAFVTATSDAVYRLSGDWSEVVHLAEQEFLVTADEPTQTWLEEYIPPDERPRVTAAIDEAIETRSVFELEHRVVRADGTRGWVHSRAVPILNDGELVEWFGTARDITERKEQKRELRQRRDELAHLNRLNTLVRELLQALQDTDSREAIETAVCDCLTASDVYQGAWIGVRGVTVTGDQMVTPQTAAGIDRPYLDDVSPFEGPAKTAVQTGSVQVVDDIATADSIDDDRQKLAVERDYHALAAIPLTTGEAIYGVLVVYPPGDQIISEDEQTLFADLGEMIAQAIQRVHSQQALNADTVVALELRFPDADLLLGEASTEFDCELTLEQRVLTNDGGAIYYLNVDDADPERVSAFLREAPAECDCTVVREADDDRPARIELRFADQPNLPTDVLSNYGGSITTARIADGDVVLGVELPLAADVRTVVDALREGAPDVELLSKQTTNRPITTGTAFQKQVTDKLSPKQETTLKAVYARGYYAWPRDTTVDELAETFDVSAPTLHYRLRQAHQTIVSAVVDNASADHSV